MSLLLSMRDVKAQVDIGYMEAGRLVESFCHDTSARFAARPFNRFSPLYRGSDLLRERALSHPGLPWHADFDLSRCGLPGRHEDCRCSWMA